MGSKKENMTQVFIWAVIETAEKLGAVHRKIQGTTVYFDIPRASEMAKPARLKQLKHNLEVLGYTARVKAI